MRLRWKNWSIGCTSGNSRYVPYDYEGDASGEAATDIINGDTKATSNHSSDSNNTVATHSLSDNSGSADTTVDDTGGNATNRVGGVTNTASNHGSSSCSSNSNNDCSIAAHSFSCNSSCGDSCSVDRCIHVRGSEKRVPRSINASSLWSPIQASSPLMSQPSNEQHGVIASRPSSLLMQKPSATVPGGDAMMVDYLDDAFTKRTSSLTEVLGESSEYSSSSRSPAELEGREGRSSAFTAVVPRSSGGSSSSGGEAASSSTSNESDPSPSNRCWRSPPRPRKFEFMHDPHNTLGSDGSNITVDDCNRHAATSDMFTEEDVNAITSLQIDAYLTTKEREEIGTRVLYSKLSGNKGNGGGIWTLAGGDGQVCKTCSMPRLIIRGSLAEVPCPVCPEVKKRVLKSILDGCS